MYKAKIKRFIKKYIIFSWIVFVRNHIMDWFYYQKRKKYLQDINNLVFSKGEPMSIISSNCFAGRIMQDLNMEYNSPTLGLYFMFPDYILFLKDLGHYLTSEIVFVEHSKYQLGDDRRAEWTISHHWYPIGLLDGNVEIHFLHYRSEKEAADAWHRRAARVNMDNLLIIGMDQNLCTEQDIREFDKLPYQRKLFFSTHNLPDLTSNVFLDKFSGKDSVGNPYKYPDLYYKKLLNK